MVSAAVCAMLASASAQAGGGLGVWEGSGVTFDGSGQEIGTFRVELTRKQVEPNTVVMEGTVFLPDGRTIPLKQKQVLQGNSFSLETPRGRGGGACFGEGICQSYEDEGNGKAFAHTIALDGPNRMRLLITELENGKAVRFMRQVLTRKPGK